MHLNAPADQGAVINQAINEARDALILSGHKDVTYLEAFVEVCNRSLDSITSRSRRDRFRIYLHLATDDAGGPAHAWLNGGVTLPASVRDALLCDGVVKPLWTTGGVPINAGRTHYIVPPHTRRAVLDRDRTRRFTSTRGSKTGSPISNFSPPPNPPPGKQYHHPTGEHFDTRWFNLTEAPVP